MVAVVIAYNARGSAVWVFDAVSGDDAKLKKPLFVI